MVQNFEISETSVIQDDLTSPSHSSSTPPSTFSSRLTKIIRRDSNLSSPKPAKVHQTQMIKLDPTDPNYISVKSSFKSRPLSESTILGIFELRMPTKLEKSHEAYKRKLSKQTNQSIGEVTHRMFHGTTSNVRCFPQRFVEEEELRFCEKDCGLCGIIQHGNRTKYTRTKSFFKRNRMWFANDPCTSLYYCNNGHYHKSDNEIKSMFVVDVIEEAPNGILVVNKERATLPRFLILFESHTGRPACNRAIV